MVVAQVNGLAWRCGFLMFVSAHDLHAGLSEIKNFFSLQLGRSSVSSFSAELIRVCFH